MTADSAGATPPPSYAEALAELDAILDELEAGDADIDALAARVERAADLVRLCRDRLDDARIEVTRIVADLDGAGAAPAAPPRRRPAPAGEPAPDPASGGDGTLHS